MKYVRFYHFDDFARALRATRGPTISTDDLWQAEYNEYAFIHNGDLYYMVMDPENIHWSQFFAIKPCKESWLHFSQQYFVQQVALLLADSVYNMLFMATYKHRSLDLYWAAVHTVDPDMYYALLHIHDFDLVLHFTNEAYAAIIAAVQRNPRGYALRK